MTRDWRSDFNLTVEALILGVERWGRTMSPDAARSAVILDWLKAGDFRPLADAIATGSPLHPTIGRALMRLAVEGRLTVASGKRGAPERPDVVPRNAQMFLAYEELRRADVGSDTAFARVAADFGIGLKSVRAAVAEMRKVSAS